MTLPDQRLARAISPTRTAALAILAFALSSVSCHPASRFGDPNQNAPFRGYMHCSFETSSFRPCNTDEEYWVSCDDPKWVNVESVLHGCSFEPCSEAGVYVELDGVLSPEGKHGHLGMFEHELTPREVYHVRSVGPEDCSWTPPSEYEPHH